MATMKYLWKLSFVIPLGVLGCAPLQQAPLVYSSKVTVGIDVSGTTTEQPGVSINLGYKQVDAAYVPVAVAKPCERSQTAGQESCTHSIYSLREIKGDNKVGNSQGSKSALEAAQKRINDFKRISVARDNAETELAKATTRLDIAKQSLATFRSEKSAELTTAKAKNVATLTSDEAALVGEDQKRKSQVDVEDAAVKIAKAQKEKADEEFNNTNVADLAEAFSLISGENNKTDAYSVFGSFDANTKAGVETGGTSAPKGEAGLVIGKVFSTGVASQNLTEGMSKYYAGLALAKSERAKADCLVAGEHFVTEYGKTLDRSNDTDKNKLKAMYEQVAENCAKDKSKDSSRNTAK